MFFKADEDGYTLARLARRAALEALSPTRCVVCERPGALVCAACASRIVYIDPRSACARCGAPFGKMLCTECQSGPDGRADARPVSGAALGLDAQPALGVPPGCGALSSPGDSPDHADSPGRCVAATVFEGVPARIVRAYKDAGERRLAAYIAQAMAESAQRAQAEDPRRFGGFLRESQAIVFVPATARAYRRRGFDHMEAVAFELAGLTGLPVLDALVKSGSSDQRKLDRNERLTASSGLYGVVEDVRSRRILLIDDVITTGATIEASARALYEAGAVCIERLAFARVW